MLCLNTIDSQDQRSIPDGGSSSSSRRLHQFPETTTTSKASSDDNSIMAPSYYPKVDDFPQTLEVDKLFEKTQQANERTFKRENGNETIANPHLPSRSTSNFNAALRTKIIRETDTAEVSRCRGNIKSPSSKTQETRSSMTRPTTRTSRSRRRQQVIQSIRQLESIASVEPRKEQEVSTTQRHLISEGVEEDTASYRPGDEMVGNQKAKQNTRQTCNGSTSGLSSYEIGRYQAYQRQQQQSPENCTEETTATEESPTMIEVTPGNFMRLRGHREVWDAVLNGTTIDCSCFGCCIELVTVPNVEMVMCVACHTISPMLLDSSEVYDDNRIGGLGLGMKKEDASLERSRYEASKRDVGRIA